MQYDAEMSVNLTRRRAQDEELEERLDASVKRVLTHNRHLAEELRLHVQARARLRAVARPCPGSR